jgi:hypothetical protein
MHGSSQLDFQTSSSAYRVGGIGNSWPTNKTRVMDGVKQTANQGRLLVYKSSMLSGI